jgi:hypothetical protein
MIEYMYKEGEKACSLEPLKVRLNGRVCGEIRKVEGGYQYFPAGARIGGQVLPSVDAVQHSLSDAHD